MISEFPREGFSQYLRFCPCKKSHRTFPEQLIGFFIFLAVSLFFSRMNYWIVAETAKSAWYQSLIQAPWALHSWMQSLPWLSYHSILAVSIWILWRSYSLRALKLETGLFFASLFFEGISTVGFFSYHETLISLIFFLLLFCNILLSALLFWKKEPLSGQLMLLPFFWIFYIMGINMAICILNPKV